MNKGGTEGWEAGNEEKTEAERQSNGSMPVVGEQSSGKELLKIPVFHAETPL